MVTYRRYRNGHVFCRLWPITIFFTAPNVSEGRAFLAMHSSVNRCRISFAASTPICRARSGSAINASSWRQLGILCCLTVQSTPVNSICCQFPLSLDYHSLLPACVAMLPEGKGSTPRFEKEALHYCKPHKGMANIFNPSQEFTSGPYPALLRICGRSSPSPANHISQPRLS